MIFWHREFSIFNRNKAFCFWKDSFRGEAVKVWAVDLLYHLLVIMLSSYLLGTILTVVFLLSVRFTDNVPPFHTRGATPSARQSSSSGTEKIHHRHQPPGDELQQLSLPRTDGFPAQWTGEELVDVHHQDVHTVHRCHNVSARQLLDIWYSSIEKPYVRENQDLFHLTVHANFATRLAYRRGQGSLNFRGSQIQTKQICTKQI